MKELRRSAVIARYSSLAKRPGISPVNSTELMYSKKTSSLISDSVNRKVVGLRWWPADLYSVCRSSKNEFLLYCLVRVIWKFIEREMYDDKRVKDCFPEPPTPTNIPEPRGISIRRLMRSKCSNASLNNTSSIFLPGNSVLCLFKNSITIGRMSSRPPPGSYIFGASSVNTPSSSNTSGRRKFTMYIGSWVFAASASPKDSTICASM
mmetsp:Transcript_64351/g.126604  ORF Transcript_64351/g.126604 Transcript_64351/m.126604 type:complete len:207 (-) Transcript_64351:2389-3009(-)